MAEFKMAAIIKLSQNEWVKFFCAKWLNPRWQNSRWLSSSSWMRMNEWSFFCAKWLNSRWLPSSSWVRMNQFESIWISLSQRFVQNSWIQDGRFQDGCHHQVNQIELVWVRVRVEWEYFWMNLREDSKVSEFKMAVSESKMAEFKMASIIKLSQNEWVKFFLCKCCWIQGEWSSFFGELKVGENGWIKLSRMNEWSFISANAGEGTVIESRLNSRWVNLSDGCLHQVESEWMREVFLCKWWEPILASVSEFERKN